MCDREAAAAGGGDVEAAADVGDLHGELAAPLA
jgi:hypothetical protein